MTWPTKTDFVDGDVLTAAQVNNIGTNLNIFDPTSATTGQVWIADGAGSGSFQPVAGGLPIATPTSTANTGGTVTIESNGVVSITGSCTSVSLNGVFTSTYKNYLVQFYSLTASAQTAPRLRLRASGTDNTTASSYQRQWAIFTNVANSYQASDNHWELPDIYATYNSAYTMYFYEPQVAVRTAIVGQHTTHDGSGARSSASGLHHTQSVAYDGFTFYTIAGPNFSGFVVVYGLTS